MRTVDRTASAPDLPEKRKITRRGERNLRTADRTASAPTSPPARKHNPWADGEGPSAGDANVKDYSDLRSEAAFLAPHVLRACPAGHTLHDSFIAYAALSKSRRGPDGPFLAGLVQSFYAIDAAERSRILNGWPELHWPFASDDLREELELRAIEGRIGQALAIDGSAGDLSARIVLTLIDGPEPVRVLVQRGTDKQAATAALRRAAELLESDWDRLIAGDAHAEGVAL
jgi:hypothetical protein